MRFVLSIGLLPLAVIAQWKFIYPDVPAKIKCPDSLFVLQQFNDGNLDTLYQTWNDFFRLDGFLRTQDAQVCRSQGLQVLGVLEIGIHKDTVAAYERFRRASAMGRNQFIYRLSVPMGVQQVYDEAATHYGFKFSSNAQAWDARWLPPWSVEPAEAKVMELRKKYHEMRVDYFNADDAEYFFRMLAKLNKVNDPAFRMLEATLMLRLGYAPEKVRSTLDAVDPRKSRVVAVDQMLTWKSHLTEMIRSLHPSFTDPKNRPAKTRVREGLKIQLIESHEVP